MLFLVDPIRPGESTLCMLIRLAYRDDSVTVDVLGSPEQRLKTVRYDLVFDYKNGKLIECAHICINGGE